MIPKFCLQATPQSKATTLVEIVFYFTLVGIFLAAAMSFAFQILQVYGVSETENELKMNAAFITERLTVTIHSAEAVDPDDSVFDADTGRLALVMVEASESPTVFHLSGGDLWMTQGTGTPIALNAEAVQIDRFKIHRATYSKSPDHLTLEGELSLVGAESSAYTQTLPFHFSLSLKNF